MRSDFSLYNPDHPVEAEDYFWIILLFTQAPIHVCLDGTIIDSSTILVTTFNMVMLGYDWWLCMVINISVQYSGGLLPDIILLTQGYYQWGTRLNTM